MIINKVKTEYDGENLKTILDVNACDCEVETLYNAVGNDIDICAMCGECYDDVELPEPIFGGAYYCECGELVYIEKVIYSKPAVIVLWSDGTKTKSTCDKEDIWNPELGLTLCVLKKIQGQSFVNKLFRDWATGASNNVITLKEVRARSKERKEALELAETLKV